jgi:uncharacterized protein (TIGR02996 family)
MAASSPSPLERYLGNPEFEAFAAAIAAVPTDEAPRLILSDWLQEQGDDAAAELARRPTFISLLAVARFQKAIGGLTSRAHGHIVGHIHETGAGLRIQMMPYLEVAPQAAIIIEERPKPKYRTVERPGRR